MTPIASADRRPNGLIALITDLGLAPSFGIVITFWITRRQPRPDQIHDAEVFG